MRKFLFCGLWAVLSAGYVAADVLPEKVSCEVMPMYGYRADRSPGRIVKIRVGGADLRGDLKVDVAYKRVKETSVFRLDASGEAEVEVMLPSVLPTDKRSEVVLTVRGTEREVKEKVAVEPMRHWTVYLYNHFHVDIGYTNTHKNVELLHRTNVKEGMKLARETAGHVDGARFVWNPEVTWPIERLWNAEPERRDEIIAAIKDGGLAVDASYVNLNTSICSDEELFHVFRFSRELQRKSGVPADVFQQFDIPGISWGLVPVMAQEGIRYVISWPNTDRGGNAHSFGMDGFPFWWVGPDGHSKVLFLQPGTYANSGSMNKGNTTGRPWFGQRNPRKVPARIRTGSANVDFTGKLVEMEKNEYPYDFIVLSWSLWDNNPVDADVPYAVNEWNKKYAYPKIVISGGHEIMRTLEEKYGDKLPVVHGDYTEYWTDGLGTAARLTAVNRRNKERITQAETVWSMLAGGAGAPRAEFDEGWRYILLGSEHTWDFENPWEPYFQDAIWKVKQSYFHEAEARSMTLLDEALGQVADKSNGALGPREGPSNGGVAVFNTQSWPHGGLVTLSVSESQKGDRVVDEAGNAVPSQRLSTGELVFWASDVPALGSRHFRVVAGDAVAGDACKIEGYTLDNGCVRVTLDEKTGNISALTRAGEEYNYIDASVDGGANSCCWLPANEDKPEADKVQSITVTEQGGLVVELKVESTMKGCRSVARTVRLVAGQPWVEISNVVDKLPLLEKDGIHFGFGFNVPQGKTLVDIPWGVMEVEKDQWPQANRNWLAVQRWIDVSNGTHGVTWCSLDAPLFEYGGRTANISLGWGGQGPWLTKLEPSSTVYSWVMNNHWHTNFPLTQDGPVAFRYRLQPHGEADIVAANRFGLEQAQPLVHVMADKNPEVKPVIALDNRAVYVTVLKSTEKDNEMIVRLRSVSDKEETVALGFPARRPSAVRLCEVEEIPGRAVGGSLTLRPYGMATLRLTF